MISLQSYVNQSGHMLRKWSLDPRLRLWAKRLGWLAAGFCLSAASLGNFAQPLTLGAVCALRGWPAVLMALGGVLGYPVFWSDAGNQGVIWLCLGLIAALIDLRTLAPGLLPAITGVIVALTGVVFQFYSDHPVPIAVYLLRIAVAVGSTWAFSGKDQLRKWFSCFAVTLAAAQIAPLPVLCLGFLLAGVLMTAASFPAAALAGLALDLAQITSVPMTGVLALGYMLRFLPHCPRWMTFTGTGSIYIAVMLLTGALDLTPVPGLMAGALIGTLLPGTFHRRKGETGAAQVRLEIVSGVLSQTRQVLLQTPEIPIDQQALFTRALERACAGCACRKSCKDRLTLPEMSPSVLQLPLASAEELPVVCKKSGRMLAQLNRAQEQLRGLYADRQRQQEYRFALIQQYGFLSEYLQELSDRLADRETRFKPFYKPQILVFGNRSEDTSGDRCLRFSGTMGRYYVLLCDGMGTGPGAAQEGQLAANLLRRLLTAGFPAEHALQSLNSLCALRERAAAVTVDLAELRLDTGRATIYKWGAAPSYIVTETGAERIGAPCPPPGLSVTQGKEQVHKISLKKGQLLVLLSDGAQDTDTLRRCMEHGSRSPGDLGRRLIAHCRVPNADDATAAVIRLLEL